MWLIGHLSVSERKIFPIVRIYSRSPVSRYAWLISARNDALRREPYELRARQISSGGLQDVVIRICR